MLLTNCDFRTNIAKTTIFRVWFCVCWSKICLKPRKFAAKPLAAWETCLPSILWTIDWMKRCRFISYSWNIHNLSISSVKIYKNWLGNVSKIRFKRLENVATLYFPIVSLIIEFLPYMEVLDQDVSFSSTYSQSENAAQQRQSGDLNSIVSANSSSTIFGARRATEKRNSSSLSDVLSDFRNFLFSTD